jgi:hypothetical protein
LTAGTEVANTATDSAKTIAKMSEQEQIFYLLRGIPRNDEWNVFLQLMMDKNTMMTTTPDEIITKLAAKDAAIKRENGLTPEALVFGKKSGKGGNGSNGGKAGKAGRSPKRDKGDNKGDKEKDFRKCFHWHRRGHSTKNC